MIYLDASALVTLISGRKYVDDLREFLVAHPDTPMGTSTVGFVETVRTLDQIGNYPTLMPDLLSQFTEMLLTDDVRDAAAHLPVRLRTLDALHIASAQIIGDALASFVAYDKQMLAAARMLGLPAAAPGFDSDSDNDRS